MQSVMVAASEDKLTTASPEAPLRKRVVLFSILALAAGIAAVIWFEHWQYERFPAFLQARLRAVSASRDAQVSEILVTPGMLVKAGQPLVRLKDTAFEQRFDAKTREIESLEIELAQNQARLEVELEWRRKNVIERIFDARLRSLQALRRETRSPLGSDFGRETAWSAAPVIPAVGGSSLTFDDRPLGEAATGGPASAAGQSPASEVDLCAQHVQELERINRELPEKISRSMGVDLARARLAHARAELARLESQKHELTLVAEQSGMVGVFQKDVGDHVSAHEPIVQLLDEEQPYLLLQIPSLRISDFSPGTVVELQFPGNRKGRGRVEEIPPQTSPISGERGVSGDTTITAHVDPVGALWPSLPFGSVVEVRRKR